MNDRGQADGGTMAATGLREEQFSQLRRRIERVVARVCPPWLRSQSDDLVQVAMLRLMDVVRQSELERNFNSSYLYKVAYSALIDQIRHLQSRREVAIEYEDGEPLALESALLSPERRTAGKELGDAINACLARLIPPRKRATTLYLLGHTAPEAAKLLQHDLKQARNLIYRGLADLRNCLAKKGIQP